MAPRLAMAGLGALLAAVWLAAGAARQGRPWRAAFGWPQDAFPLAVWGTGLLWYLARPAPVGAYALWGAGMALALACQPTLPNLGPVGRTLGRPWVAGGLVLAGVFAALACKFPLSQWGQLVFFDDYPTLYYASVRGLATLAQGGVFGWDTRLLGGYYAVSDVNHNLALFLLPFAPFGMRVGYHLLIAASILAFPVLLALWVRKVLRDAGTTALGFWLGGFFALTVLDNLLHWGMLNSFLGLDLLVTALLLWERVRERRPWAVFPLALALGLAVYAHVAFFLYALAFLGLEFLRQPARTLARDLALAVGGALVLSLPMTAHYLLYPGYFIENNEAWAPQVMTATEALARSLGNLASYGNLNAYLALPVKYQALFLMSVPAAAWVAWRRPGPARGVAGYAALAAFAAALEVPGLTLALERLKFVLPVFLAVVWAAWAWDGRAGRPRLAALSLVAAMVWVAWPPRATWPLAHVRALRDFHPALMDQVARLPAGEWVVWEAQSSYDLIDDPSEASPHGPQNNHLEAFLPLETDKRYLTHIQEGYHHSIYRGNVLNAGAFRGRAIREVPLEEMQALLDRWGVGHLVVWSEPSRRYFGARPDLFAPVWSDGQWTVFAYAGADPRQVLVPHGQGRLESEGAFGFRVVLEGVRAGDPVVVRQNAFPAWRAFWGGREVALYADDGRLAFHAPADGTYAVTFRYPRYARASAAALAVLAAGLGSGVAHLWKRRERDA
ncbi:MAG: hypothetical protein H5T59_07385 [Anaerolineae bacterium]|nr:hypothetical protein [Anaerolineae bacterium]